MNQHDEIQSADQLIGQMLNSLKAIAAKSAEEVERYEWIHNIRPALVGLGIELRHAVRMREWNCDQQEAAFEATKHLCKRTGAIVALCGSRGTGKTTIATQIMRERLEARNQYYQLMPEERPGRPPLEPGKYVKLGHLGARYKALVADFGTTDPRALQDDFFGRYASDDLLVVDEIHEGDDLRTHSRLLVDLVDTRYARNLDTILISNHDPEKFITSMDASVISRASQHGAVIPCLWDSWRAKSQN